MPAKTESQDHPHGDVSEQGTRTSLRSDIPSASADGAGVAKHADAARALSCWMKGARQPSALCLYAVCLVKHSGLSPAGNPVLLQVVQDPLPLSERLIALAAAISVDYNFLSPHSSGSGWIAPPLFMPIPSPSGGVGGVGAGAGSGAEAAAGAATASAAGGGG